MAMCPTPSAWTVEGAATGGGGGGGGGPGGGGADRMGAVASKSKSVSRQQLVIRKNFKFKYISSNLGSVSSTSFQKC